MIGWLIAVIVCLLVFGLLWKKNPLIAFGVLVGVLLAWLISWFLKPVIAGMETIPLWLPPLPLATVALVLFVYGSLVWIRGSEGLPKKGPEADDEHH